MAAAFLTAPLALSASLLPGRGATVPPRRSLVRMSSEAEGIDTDALMRRIEDVSAGVTDCRLWVSEGCVVPGQRMNITAPPEVVELFADSRTRPVVALGRDRAEVHSHGVEVKLRALQLRPVVPNIHPEGTADIVLEACRIVRVNTVPDSGHRWLGRPARGKWVELDAEQEGPPEEEVLARSEAIGTSATTWVGLVRSTARGKFQNQLDEALQDLGPMPAADKPNARALWVAGLINPVKGVRLATEVRAAVLMAASVENRLRTVESALGDSLRRLQAEATGSERGS